MKHSLALLLLCALAAASDQPSGGDIDFTTYPSYSSFRQCLKAIFAPYLQFGMTVPGELIGCTTNECLCEPNNIASNVPLLYSTASRACSNTVDAQSATGILDGYCSSVGYTEREAALTTGSGGSGTTTKPKAVAATKTSTVLETTTLDSGVVETNPVVVLTDDTAAAGAATDSGNSGITAAASKDNNDLSVGSIVGIVVGALGFIATAVGVYFAYKQYKSSRGANVVPGVAPEQVAMMERGTVYAHSNPSLSQGYGYNNAPPAYNNPGWR